MRRILVIEDDEVQAAGAMRILRREGMHCDHSRTFEDALTRTAEVTYDCAVYDLGLPDEDIHNEYEAVRRIPELGCPVVVWTGSGDPGIIAAVRATGASIVLKPGAELLVHNIWSQIQYQNPDRESEIAQMNAQRALQKKDPESLWSKATKAVPAVLLAGALLKWSFSMAQQYDVTRQEVAAMNRRMDTAEAHSVATENHLRIVDTQNQISIDDRANLHTIVSSLIDNQTRHNEAIDRRLDKLDEHILELMKKTK